MVKKFLLFAAAVLVGLAGCTEEGKETPVLPVEMSSFGFYAEDNAGVLHSDVTVSSVSRSMKVTLPYGTTSDDLKTLVPRFEVTEGASVTVNNEPVESGKTAVDFSFPAEFLVTLNEKSTALYTVTVAVANPATWTKVAEVDGVDGTPDMSLDPVSGEPYVLTYLDNEDSDLKYPVLYKGPSLDQVGGNLVESRISNYALGFAADGTPYTLWYNPNTKNTNVYSVGTSGATLIGAEKGIPRVTGNATGSNAVVAISPSDVYAFTMANAADATAGYPKRGLNVAHFDGSSWTNGYKMPDWPVADRTYNIRSKWVSGVPYVFVLDFDAAKFYVYKYEDGWKTVCNGIQPVKTGTSDPITTAHYKYSGMTFDVASNGDVYIAAAANYSPDSESNLVGVMKYDIKTGTMSLVGGLISVDDVDIDDCRYMCMALDQNDVPYLAISNTMNSATTPTTVRYVDAETQLWSEPVTLTSAKTDGIGIAFDENGKGYISYLESDTNKLVLLSNSAE